MLNIVICDNSPNDIQTTQTLLHAYQLTHAEFQYTSHSFHSVPLLLSAIEDGAMIDVLFLDIYMNDMTGVQAATQLRTYGFRGQIVFQTSSKEHAFDAFSVGATQYLVKPIDDIQFTQTMDRVLQHCKQTEYHYITLHVNGGTQKVRITDIVYAQTHGNYQHITLANGETLIARMTATGLSKSLEQEGQFVQISKAYLLNLNFVEHFNAKEITLSNDTCIAMPRGHFTTFKDAYFDFLQSDHLWDTL